MEKNHAGEVFYQRMGLLLILLIILGFGPFINHRIATEGSIALIFIVHGVIFLLWYSLFTFQASLVGKRNLKLHRKLGKSSIFLAVAMVITSIITMKDSFARGSSSATPFTPEQFILLPMFDIIMFIMLYTLAYKARKIADSHKHYMLLAGIVMIDPATARLGISLGAAPIGMLFHFALVGAVFAYDWKRNKAIHIASKIALLLLVIYYASLFVIGPTEMWSSFVHTLFD